MEARRLSFTRVRAIKQGKEGSSDAETACMNPTFVLLQDSKVRPKRLHILGFYLYHRKSKPTEQKEVGSHQGLGEGGEVDSKGRRGKLAGVELFCEESCGAGLESGTAGCTQAYLHTYIRTGTYTINYRAMCAHGLACLHIR